MQSWRFWLNLVHIHIHKCMVLWCWYILDDKIHSLQAFVCIIQIINLRYNEFQNLLVDGVGIVFRVICFNGDVCILLSYLRIMVVDLDYHWNRNKRWYIFLLATIMILSCLLSSLESELLENDNLCFCESLVTLEMSSCSFLSSSSLSNESRRFIWCYCILLEVLYLLFTLRYFLVLRTVQIVSFLIFPSCWLTCGAAMLECWLIRHW